MPTLAVVEHLHVIEQARAGRFHNRALAEPAGAQDYVDREWSEERVKQRYEWLFTYDVTAVAV